MDASKRFICNCYVCGVSLIFNTRKNKKRHSCKSCRRPLCQGCQHKTASENGKMAKKCAFCFDREKNQNTNENISTSIISSNNTDFSKFVEDMVNCPICQDCMKKPIVLCTLGHSMCGTCVAGKVTICPLCRATLSKTRNYALEKFLSDLNLTPRYNYDNTCKYLERGCAKYFEKENDKIMHEKECTLRDYKCPLQDSFGNCQYVGKVEEFVDHFERYHDEKVWRHNTEGIVKIGLDLNIDNFTIIDFMNGKHYFLLRHRIDQCLQKAYWAIQLMGSREAAKEYSYKFEISKGRRKWKVTEICRSDVTDCNEIFESENCFSISFRNLITFLDGNDQLKIKFHIYKQVN